MVGGAVGARRLCGSGCVVFVLVVVRAGRVLGEVEFFWFRLAAHVRVGAENGLRKRKESQFKII